MGDKEKISLSKGFAELERIVSELESREIDLEKDLPTFARGMSLAQRLQKRLREIENKVVEIDKKYAGDEDKDNEAKSVL